MRSLEQIIADNGNDNTPALDTHNLTGRALCKYESAESGTLLCVLTMNHEGDHVTPSYAGQQMTLGKVN